MLKRNRDVNCQNCYNMLGVFLEDNFHYNPSELETIVDEITSDKVLITLTCPKCSCKCEVIV